MLVLVAVAAFFARPIAELLPGFVDELFGRGPAGLAIVTSAMGLGAVFSGVWIARKGSVTGLTKITLVSILCNGIAVLVAVSTPWFWLSTTALCIAGFAQLASGTGSQTLIQHAINNQMRGRVMGLWAMIQRGAPAAGALVLGWLSEFFGFTWPLVVGSIVAIIAAGVVLRRRRSLEREFEHLPSLA